MGCNVKDKKIGKNLIQGVQSEGLYKLQETFAANCCLVENNHEGSSSERDLWHRRLGHPSEKVLSEILKSCNMTFLLNKNCSFCETCQLGKSHALRFKKFESHAVKPLDLVHTDLWGPAPFQSSSGCKYYIFFWMILVDICGFSL